MSVIKKLYACINPDYFRNGLTDRTPLLRFQILNYNKITDFWLKFN